MPARSLPFTRLLLFLAAVVLLGVAGAAAGGGIAFMRSRPSSAALTASGTLEADEATIAPQVSGAITSLPAPEGNTVAMGAVLATISDRSLQLQMQNVADPTAQQNLRLQQDNYVLRAPFSGVVTRVPVHVGDTAAAGEVLAAVAPVDHLKLTIYVREADLSKVFVGQALAITADPFGDRIFNGRVTSINQQAEFTPKNIQTQTDRLNLVFGVQATVDNPDGALKAGMPVDARFEPGSVP